MSEVENTAEDLQHYVPITRQHHRWKTNWKILTENFMEGYHLPVAHRATVGTDFPVEQTRFGKTSHSAFTYQSFEKTADAPVGNAHPDNNRLTGAQRYTSIMPTVFPSHMYVLAPDHLWYLSLQPDGVDHVNIIFGAALAPEVLAGSDDAEKLKRETTEFLEQVNEEDRGVVEGVFASTGAALAQPGPLCWLEQESLDFMKYLNGRLNNATSHDASSGATE